MWWMLFYQGTVRSHSFDNKHINTSELQWKNSVSFHNMTGRLTQLHIHGNVKWITFMGTGENRIKEYSTEKESGYTLKFYRIASMHCEQFSGKGIPTVNLYSLNSLPICNWYYTELQVSSSPAQRNLEMAKLIAKSSKLYDCVGSK